MHAYLAPINEELVGLRRLARALSGIAQQRSDLSLTPADHSAMAFAHGMGHGWTHLVFFYLW